MLGLNVGFENHGRVDITVGADGTAELRSDGYQTNDLTKILLVLVEQLKTQQATNAALEFALRHASAMSDFGSDTRTRQKLQIASGIRFGERSGNTDAVAEEILFDLSKDARDVLDYISTQTDADLTELCHRCRLRFDMDGLLA